MHTHTIHTNRCKINTHTQPHTDTHTKCIRTQMHTHTQKAYAHKCTHTHKQIHTHKQMYTRKNKHTHKCIHTNTYLKIHTHKQMNTHTHTHKQIHTHMHTRLCWVDEVANHQKNKQTWRQIIKNKQGKSKKPEIHIHQQTIKKRLNTLTPHGLTSPCVAATEETPIPCCENLV